MLNFNQLAWESSEINGEYGYLPEHEHYEAIVAWLRTGRKIWSNRTGDITETRITFSGMRYDAIVRYRHTDGLIGWIFREVGTYEV